VNDPATPPTLRRYVLPSQDSFGGWGIFVIASDGYFSCVSDYGNYAFRWTAIGEGRDFRDFLAQIGSDYLLSKISPGPTYDGDLTEKNVLALIQKQLEEGLIDEDDAERERELLREESHLENEIHFYRWSEETAIEHDVSEIYETSHPSDVIAFCEKLLPRFQAALRAELAEERDKADFRYAKTPLIHE